MRTLPAVLLLALAAVASAQPPVPALTGRVVDTAEILSPAVEATLTERLAAHEDSTSNQVAVLTIPALDGAILEPYATEVFRTWGLGQADRDNGVLLLVARDDRELRIEVGYGLEGSLTDATSGTIIRREIVPRFRDGDFDGGVLAGVDAILGSIEGTYETPSDSGFQINDQPAEDAPWWMRLMIGALFGLVPLAAIGGPILWTGTGGDVGAGCAGAFVGLFTGFGLAFLFLNGWVFLLGVVGVPVGLVLVNRWLEAHPVYGPARRERRRRAKLIREAQARGDKTVVIDGVSHRVPARSSGSSGGGFSGGGGSSGGGGASGSW